MRIASLFPAAFALAGLSACASVPTNAEPVQTASGPQLSAADAQAILAKTQTIRLAPDLSHLGPGERIAVAKLLEVGQIFQDIYEDQNHSQALAIRARLEPGSDEATLYRLFQGPLATDLANRRVPFAGATEPPPGQNVYPLDLTKAEYDAYLAAHPDRAGELTHLRSVVRRTDDASLARDIAALRRHPALETLHPGMLARLEAMARAPDRMQLYAVPYSVAWADRTVRASRLLFEGADAVEGEDAELARYLRNRARDLLSDDYESGDAAWITGEFKNLNAEIGAYETYDDELSGVRAFYALSLLSRRNAETEALRRGLGGLQAVEDALPYADHKRVRENIPVGIYDVVADFGQSRGGNTATILPNEAYLARRYGRTILLRANIMRSPEIFATTDAGWTAVVEPRFADDLTAEGQFNRTLWHEIGHYLGADATSDGRDLDTALGADASLLEEMKADLVSLFAGPQLVESGFFTADKLRNQRASGILRTLQNNPPRRDQPYQTMQLMQFNWFLDRGVLAFDPASGRLIIDYDEYQDAVTALLREVIALQQAGDPQRSDAFVRRWLTWDEQVHGRIAQTLRDRQSVRYRQFKYAALGE